MKKLIEWYDLYPQGTQEGNEEQQVFIALVRNKKWKNWNLNTMLTDNVYMSGEILTMTDTTSVKNVDFYVKTLRDK